jgi:hypothetical protein
MSLRAGVDSAKVVEYALASNGIDEQPARRFDAAGDVIPPREPHNAP